MRLDLKGEIKDVIRWYEATVGVMGEGFNNYVRITRNPNINFHIYNVIIIPFKVINIFPKILRFSFKTAIN
jgi:hypothetical protein